MMTTTVMPDDSASGVYI